MNVGLYFGSFNPIHNGHLIIANHIVQNTVLDKLWFVVSPLNPFKSSDQLLNENQRYHLVQVAIEGETKLKASNIEFSLPRPSYTIHTLTYLKEKYPNDQFFIVMGSDGFQNIDKWKNSEYIINNYTFIIYPRPGFEIENKVAADIIITETPWLMISSTYIRKCLKENKSIRYLVPDNVLEEIEKSGSYKSSSKKKTG